MTEYKLPTYTRKPTAREQAIRQQIVDVYRKHQLAAKIEAEPLERQLADLAMRSDAIIDWGYEQKLVEMMLTTVKPAPSWKDIVSMERAKLGRDLTLDELLLLAKDYKMTPEEIEVQRQSWARQDMD